MNRKEMLEHIKDQNKEVFSLIAKVIEVIQTHSLWGSEDEYVFEDGEIWYRFDPDYELTKTANKSEVIIAKEEASE